MRHGASRPPWRGPARALISLACGSDQPRPRGSGSRLRERDALPKRARRQALAPVSGEFARGWTAEGTATRLKAGSDAGIVKPMPIFEYQCRACGAKFELIVGSSA